MQIFTQIFDNKVDRYLNILQPLNPKFPPQSLFKVLKSKSQQKYLQKKLSSKTSNIFKLFKRLSVCSMLVMHSNKFYDLVGEVPYISSGNKWIDKEFLEPYNMFLKKICLSNQMYQNTKKQCPMPIGKNMEMLFYNIGLLKLLFRIVAKMPLLGRYYKSKNEQLVCTFVNTLAMHAQKIYISFRQILSHMIDNPKVHIPTRADELIMKGILQDQLNQINEQMKKLFLDKYFYPLGKGIGIKLFRTQQQPIQSQKIIMGIINDHQHTNRQRQKNQLQMTLFPQPGKINVKFIEQTLIGGNLMGEELNSYQEQVAEVDIGEQDGGEEDCGDISIEERFGRIQLPYCGKKVNQNDIETGIQRYEESLHQL